MRREGLLVAPLERTCDGAGGADFLRAIAAADCGRWLSVDDARWLACEIRRFSTTRSAAFMRAGLAYAMTGAQEAFARGTRDLGEAALSAEVRRCMTLLEDEPALSRRDLADHASADPDVLLSPKPRSAMIVITAQLLLAVAGSLMGANRRHSSRQRPLTLGASSEALPQSRSSR